MHVRKQACGHYGCSLRSGASVGQAITRSLQDRSQERQADSIKAKEAKCMASLNAVSPGAIFLQDRLQTRIGALRDRYTFATAPADPSDPSVASAFLSFASRFCYRCSWLSACPAAVWCGVEALQPSIAAMP